MTTGDQQLPGGAVAIYRAAHRQGTLMMTERARYCAARSRSALLGTSQMQHKIVTLCLLLMSTGDQLLPGGAVTIYRAAHRRGTLSV